MYPLFVDYGQPCQPGEYRAARTLIEVIGLEPIEIVSVPQVAHIGVNTLRNGTEYFPSRNLFLLTLAAMYAYRLDISDLMIGLIRDSADMLPDCSPEFLKRVGQLLNLEYPRLTIHAPFITRTKNDIVQEAVQYGLNPQVTFCCNDLADHHCWRCSSCQDRLHTLRSLQQM